CRSANAWLADRTAPIMPTKSPLNREWSAMSDFRKGVISALYLFLIAGPHAAAQPAPAPKAAKGATEILFQDDFEKAGAKIDTTKWVVSKTKDTDVIEVRRNAWPNTSGFAVITDSGDQGGTHHGHASAIASKMSFPRGRNLRCTFKVAMPAH